MFTWKLSNVDTEFLFLSQRNRIFCRVRLFRLSILFYLVDGSCLAWGPGRFGWFLIRCDSLLVKIGLSNYLEVILFEFLSDPDEINVALIESVTVPDDLIDVGVELGWRGVKSGFKVVFNFGQVHRLFDDFEVLGDS